MNDVEVRNDEAALPPGFLMGAETEYAVSGAQPDGTPVAVETVVMHFLELIKPHRQGSERGSGRFYSNGGLLYIDHGLHPEWATPECASPGDVVRYLRAGDHLVWRLARQVVDEMPSVDDVFCTRCGVDYLTGTFWGSHESYLCQAVRGDLEQMLLPFLASRVAVVGAGGWTVGSAGLHFTLSPRAHAITEVRGTDTMAARPLFHTKDESLSGTGSFRLHLCCSDALCSDEAALLRYGTTALVIRALERRARPVVARVPDPVQALRIFAADPTCAATIQLEGDRHVTALDLQRRYLAMVEDDLGDASTPPWAEHICRRWRRTLDDLSGDGSAASRSLDWAIKRRLYAHHLEQRGIAWETLPAWNAVIQEVRRQEQPRRRAPRPFDPRPLTSDTTAVRAAIEGARRTFDTAGLREDQWSEVMQARVELREIDTRFAALGPSGLFNQLDAAGVLRHRADGLDTTQGLDRPPVGTRAQVRGDVIRRLDREGASYRVEWTRLLDLGRRRALNLRDPFETTERWATAPERG